ncbi:MAG: Ig-like domain-containing protein [Muribaculaceae bacterium]|nr:Ig-like domain-containing protein [Muribaculaceae bacterium]
MKKIITLLALALASSSMPVSGQSLGDTQTLWAKFVTNSDGGQSLTTQGNQMVLSPDGGLYVVGQAGSTSSSQNIMFGDEVVASGIDYSGNGANQGLLMMKLDNDGNVVWKLAQTNGESGSNENWVASTPDGGAVLLVNLRHTEGHLGESITITDAQGTDFAIDWTVSERSYRAAVIKVDADGGIEWTRQIEANATADEATYPAWSQSSRHIGQGVKTYALDVDNSGNIYIGGLMCATMNVDGVTIEPHNVAGWNGNAQTTVGNLFVIKFDAQGNYVKHLVTEGESTQESARSLKVVGNKLYMAAWVTGLAGTSLGLGSQQVTPSTTNPSWMLAELDTDLNVAWLKLHECTVSGSAWQMPTMTVAGNHIYLMGSAKYGIQIDGNNITNQPTNKARQSWLLQFDASNGEAVKASVLATGPMQMQHGFFGAYEGCDGSLYAIERGLTPSASFGSELMLYKYNMESLEVVDQVQLATGSCDGQSLVTDGDYLYVMNRFGNKNESCTFLNSDITHSSAAYNWGQSAYRVPMGAVQDIVLDAEQLELTPGESGQITATIMPEGAANSDIIWTSSNEGVVTVADGIITAAEANSLQGLRRAPGDVLGNAIVTATSASNPNVKKNIAVTVQEGTATGVADLNTATSHNGNVYTMDGRLVRRGTSSTTGLPAGIYIAGGRKVAVK